MSNVLYVGALFHCRILTLTVTMTPVTTPTWSWVLESLWQSVSPDQVTELDHQTSSKKKEKVESEEVEEKKKAESSKPGPNTKTEFEESTSPLKSGNWTHDHKVNTKSLVFSNSDDEDEEEIDNDEEAAVFEKKKVDSLEAKSWQNLWAC